MRLGHHTPRTWGLHGQSCRLGWPNHPRPQQGRAFRSPGVPSVPSAGRPPPRLAAHTPRHIHGQGRRTGWVCRYLSRPEAPPALTSKPQAGLAPPRCPRRWQGGRQHGARAGELSLRCPGVSPLVNELLAAAVGDPPGNPQQSPGDVGGVQTSPLGRNPSSCL